LFGIVMSVRWRAVCAVQLVVVSGSSDDVDADLALSFLVVVLVSWLPVGTARCLFVPVRGGFGRGVGAEG
jgi:hypothetical protein